jgi:hypothetical protein
MNLPQQIILIVVSYPFIIYAIAFITICIEPYWYDNSPRPEYIPLADRWGWALLVSFFFAIYGFPLLVAAIGVTIYLSKRQR